MDIIKKVLTFKSGNFVFSAKFNDDKGSEIANKIVEVLIAFESIKYIPILPNMASQIEEELIKKSIFSTAAIEGNSLTQEDVDKIIEDNKTNFSKERFVKEIQNLKTAYDKIKDINALDTKILLSQDLIKNYHKIITDGLENETNIPGQYRNTKVIVGNEEHGGTNVPPKIFEDIKKLMEEFILWINSKELLEIPPIFRACIAHLTLALIHPFGDGNGRTSRIIEAHILKSAGYRFVYTMLSNYYYKNIDEYFITFSKVLKNEDNDISDFVLFYLKGLLESIKTIREKIYIIITGLSLQSYLLYLKKTNQISPRQYDFLSIMLDNNKEVTEKEILEDVNLKIIYGKLSSRTLKRDLDYLLKANLLMLNRDTQKYRINFFVLNEEKWIKPEENNNEKNF
ncbi:Fic family protein [Candidatus Ruminimicrobium bovinum]|uniref:Fic family protein n=1 Tax=Candidatus Ruminimicrobium bovinum TaxID=3242779 RepID=UPI0039B95EC7